MKKWQVRLLLLLAVVLVAFYFLTKIVNHSVKSDEVVYLADRGKIYELVNADEFNSHSFKDFLATQATYNFLQWPQEYFWSVTFTNPRGGPTIFHDIIIATALGIERLIENESLTPDVTRAAENIISRRRLLWHDWSNTNHYAREYAALGALANVTNHKSFTQFQQKLHKSLNKLFNPDGSSTEGTSYGLYTIKLLVPYVYLTNDQIVAGYINRFRSWLEKNASLDDYLPPFDDSPAIKLPRSMSAFAQVNEKLFNDPLQTTANQLEIGKNETVIKYKNYTLWARHRQAGSDLNTHRHFSALDIMIKTKNHWWVIPSGYPGWDQKFDKPYLQNIVTHQSFLGNDSIWRLASVIKRKKPKVDILADNTILLSLGALNRQIITQPDQVEVRDYDTKPFTMYWNIKGDLIEQAQQENGQIFKFKQGEEIMDLEIIGAQKLLLSTGQHSLDNKIISQHTLIKVKGDDVISKFRW